MMTREDYIILIVFGAVAYFAAVNIDALMVIQ